VIGCYVQSAIERVDDKVESQPLWEYPGLPLTDAFEVMTFDLSRPLSGLKTITRNGIVDFWRSANHLVLY
jgi:hypothetical protein